MPILTPSPDPNPKSPGFRIPEGAIDTHFHAFGEPAIYPFHKNSKYVSEFSSIDDYFEVQKVWGMKRAVLVSGGAYGPDFTYMADMLKRYPDRLRGVALLPEDVADEELHRLHALGVRGARFASPAHGGVMPVFSERIAHRIFELGWHVQYYPHASDFADSMPRLLGLPNTIVLDHFASVPAARGIAQPAFTELLRMMDTGRVWVKLSGPMRCTADEPPYACVTPLARALIAHAGDRVVWGSDWPHVNMHGRVMPNDGELLDQLQEWAPDEKQRNAILVDNPEKLYDFHTC